ncbi:MAG: glycosyltransferase family 2 protein [Marinovum sp.]|nr:glycosyltransferase family 2 protein [Marinovum sp.]
MPERLAVTAAMRNEGIHLLEWVAYHQVIGFDRVIIHTNECTDGSDTLLNHLCHQGLVEHLCNAVPAGEAPQSVAMGAVLQHLKDEPTEWLLHCDADEFLNIGIGAGRLPDLMANMDEADVIALPWFSFGDSGCEEWPGATLPNFVGCENAIHPETVKFKSMFRPALFGFAHDHMPVQPKIDNPRVVNALGEALPNDPLYADKRAKYRPFERSIKPHAAVLNHYATRSHDVFLMKNDRGDGQGKTTNKYHLGSTWHRVANRNDREDRRILRHWPATQARLDGLRADPTTKRLEGVCIDWWETRKADVLTHDNRKAWSKGPYREALA